MRCGMCTFAFLSALHSVVLAQHTPGYLLTEYAQFANPSRMSAGEEGVMWSGHEDNGTATEIWRVEEGVAKLFGDTPLQDPDAVGYDGAGLVSGVPGTVLVGGIAVLNPAQGAIWGVAPDETTGFVFGPSEEIGNVSHIRVDSKGRLVFTESSSGRVMVSEGGAFPTRLFGAGAAVVGIALDAGDRIYLSRGDGRITIHNPDGTLADGGFVGAGAQATQLRWSDGGEWGLHLYGADQLAGEIVRFEPDGAREVLATGMPDAMSDLDFGDDGALYINAPGLARMLRLSPCAPNINGDGAVNTLDVLEFLNAWTAGDPRGDFNHDGSVNTLDVLAFLNAWAAGC